MLAAISEFHASYNWKKLLTLFLVAFIARAIPFHVYLQHNERYHQADSMDYHVCALGLYYGIGIKRLDNKWPIFWRTPGYPAYLAAFYKAFGVTNPQFPENSSAQKAALWVQIFLSALTPLLVFFLVLTLVPVIPLAWLVAWIFAFHVGFILASGYLLTEALAVLLFYAYLIFFYKKYRMIGEVAGESIPPLWHVVASAFFLAAYTWLRPMGQFIALVTMLLYICGAMPWKDKLIRAALFGVIFLGLLSPWIMRNYNYTGKLFFWPGSGSYLASFNVPKIMRRISGKEFGECHAEVMKQASQGIRQEHARLQREEPNHFVSQELVCAKIAWPWVVKYPWYFIQDWFVEVCKTTFDLYGSQLVNFARNTYKYDPMEEFLTEKLADCIYKQPMHWFMRFLCWLELLFNAVMWAGIAAGCATFFIQPLLRKLKIDLAKRQMFFVWIKAGIMIAVVLGMTGGFGYARLRMPVEPLMVLLSATFWYYLWCRNNNKG